MGKDLLGNELGKGFMQRKDGRYYGRRCIKGVLYAEYGQTKEEAEQKLNCTIKKAEYELKFPALYGEKSTLNKWFEDWFELYKKRQLKTTGHRAYKSRFFNLFGKRIGEVILSKLTHIQIQLVVNELVDEEYSAKTINAATSALRDCLKAAVANEYIRTNVAEGLILPAIVETEPRVLNREEHNAMLEYLEMINDWYEEMWKILLVTGLRIGECGALQVEDIDFVKKQIKVTKTLHCWYAKEGKELLHSSPKTRNSCRIIPFLGEAEEILKKQLEKREKLKTELGERWRVPEELGNLLFVTSLGSPVTRYIADNRMRGLNEELKLFMMSRAIEEGRIPDDFKNITPHTLRHTFCTRLFMMGKKAEYIMKIMGHAKYQTTLRYIHIANDMMKTEFENVESMLNW